MYTFCSHIGVWLLMRKSCPTGFELWDDHEIRVEEVIALVSNHGVARAAFAEAIKRRPGKIITLRQKSRVLSDSRE